MPWLAYSEFMSAMPAEHDDPLDPQRILTGLPEDEREFFLSQYRQAVEAARLAKAAGRPVQVMRSREEEIFHDTFRPAAVELS